MDAVEKAAKKADAVKRWSGYTENASDLAVAQIERAREVVQIAGLASNDENILRIAHLLALNWQSSRIAGLK